MSSARPWRSLVPVLVAALCACNSSTSGAGGTTAIQGSTVAKVSATDPNCPNGGHTLTYGVDKNGNGVLDADEVTGTFDICDGIPGSLTLVSTINAGSTCSEGGVLVQVGPDTNGNGTLDPNEVTSSAPVCSARGNITSVLGNVSILNDDDVADFLDVETISGGLNIDLNGIGNITLPHLTRAGLITATVYGDLPFLALSPPPTTAGSVSFPALTYVDAFIYINEGVTVSAPALTTVHGGDFRCGDANAVLSALTTMGGELDCGNPNLIYQLSTVSELLSVTGPTATYPNMVYFAVDPNSGAPSGSGTLYFEDYTLTDASFPLLQVAGAFEFQNFTVSPNITFPALTTVGQFHVNGSQTVFDPNFSAPQWQHIAGFYFEENTATGAYANIINQLTTLGGELGLSGSGEIAINNAGLTTVSSINVTQNSNLTTFATSQLAQVTLGDSNYNLFDQNVGEGAEGNCGATVSNGGNPNCVSVYFMDNPNLTSVNLGQVSSIDGVLVVMNDPNLTSLQGVDHLVSVGGNEGRNVNSTNVNASVIIAGTGLTAVGFGSSLQAPAVVAIINNPNLTDISGLSLAPGDATTCPVFKNNPQLNYCAAARLVGAYNIACALNGNPADYQLLDPCSGNPCGSGTCSVNCLGVNGYACN